ncbi:MAG: hemolysin III family protein [Lachnospiraceae bacterium]|nr:hemolysin III family protein [Lachnospiraceae bacterium]
MTRTKLADRVMPDYTRGEELMNMITHIIGGAFGVVALVLCLVFSAKKADPFLITTSAIYGASLIILYTNSSVYHGLKQCMGKRVMQVLDHCTIYLLVGGTYTPILLGAVRHVSPALAWTLFGLVWGLCALGCTFTAIDLKKFTALAMSIYIGIGWCVIFASKAVIRAVSMEGFMWLLWGGISYTVGAVLYGLGVKHRYMHSVFHIFVLLGSILHFFCILMYVIGF